MLVKVEFEKSVYIEFNKDMLKEMLDNDADIDLTNNKSIEFWLKNNLEWDSCDEEFERINSIEWNETEFNKLVNEIKEEIQQEKLVEESKPFENQISLF